VHRDVPPLAAAKYVGPRLGVVRAGNGFYWQFGLIRADKGTNGSPPGSAGSAGSSGPGSSPGASGDGPAAGSAGGAGSSGVHHAGCAVVSRCQDNMEGAMPKWVVSVMASKGAPAYVSTLQVTRARFHTRGAYSQSFGSRQNKVTGALRIVVVIVPHSFAHCFSMLSLALCGYNTSRVQRAAVRLMLQDGLVSESEAKERWHYA
jgi:hypothetical protein